MDLDKRIREAYEAHKWTGDIEDMVSFYDFKAGFLAALPRWIPVGERLPEPNKPVLVFYVSPYWLNPTQSVAMHYEGIRWRQLIGGDDMPSVTHWMPLPQPPEVD